MRADRGTLRSGGDGGRRGLQGIPPVERPSRSISGIVKVDADGTAKVDFELPDFNGTVRVMAVAWSTDKLGHGFKDVIVRDAVALTGFRPALPDARRRGPSRHSPCTTSKGPPRPTSSRCR